MKLKLNARFIVTAVLLLFSIGTLKAQLYNAVVARDGSGKYRSVQAAIDAVPAGSKAAYRILIKQGIYNEQIHIPADKPFITLIGESPANTTIAFGDGKGGTTTLTVDANDVTLINLTLENTQGRVADGPQSLAVKTNADRIVFLNCRFISGQDTVYVNKAGQRVYFKNCYIDGNTDFIYGSSVAVFDDCIIYPRDRVDYGKGGYVTAASTPVGQPFGLVFRNCILPDNHGVTTYSLGRPWQNDASTTAKGRVRAGNKTVFLNTMFGRSIIAARWTLWDEGTETDKMIYAEFESADLKGNKLNLDERAPWSKVLTSAEARPYLTNKAIFNDWNPIAGLNAAETKLPQPPVTITNFIARYTGDRTVLQFNSSWPVAGVTYTLYRSNSNQDKFKEVTHCVSGNDRNIAYQLYDELPPAGQTSYYFLKATGTGQVAGSDTLTVNRTQITKRLNATRK